MRPPVRLRRGQAPTSATGRSSAIPTNCALYGADARRSEDVLLTRFDAAALVPVLQGRQYLLVHVERASDILQVLGLRRDFPALKIVLVGRERRLDWSPTGSRRSGFR